MIYHTYLKQWPRCLVALLFLLLGLQNEIFAQEIVTVNPNGDFENSAITISGDTSSVEGWSFELGDGADASFAIIDSMVYAGERALQVSIGNIGSNAWSIQVINEPFEVNPGQVYEFSVWVKAAANGIGSFTVGNPSFQEFGRLSEVEITDTWKEVSFQFTPGANESVGRAPIHLSFSGNENNVFWLDELNITTQADTTDPLDPIALGKPKWLGNIYSQSQFPRFTEYWNQVTPENAGKWGSVESTRDVMNWGSLDAAYALAKDNGLPFRFHVLVWGNQQPTWMKTLSDAEQLEELEEWFTEVANRYPDIDYLEVVNEPLHDPPTDDASDSGSGGYFEALGGSGETGWDWVINAFQMADSIFADSVQLMINDFNILGSAANVNRYAEIIELLQDRGLIDIVGAQGHHFSTKYVSNSVIQANLNTLSSFGMPLQITELDINGSTSNNSEAAQLAEYKRVFPTIWNHDAVMGVTLWGWRPGLWVEDAVLIESGETERSSLEWLRNYVESTEVTVSNEDNVLLPSQFVLNQNYPNPFNPTTQISYSLPSSGLVTLNVYDITGRKVASLVNEVQTAGEYAVTFNGIGLASGIYLYELKMGNFRSVHKMILLK